MLKRIVPLIVFVFMFSISSNAIAYKIQKGTVSVGGSSNMVFGNYDSDNTSDSNLIGFSVSCGYFFIDNLEIGAALSASYQDDDDDSEYKYYSISPLITYHFDLNEKSNLFITGMFGFSKSYSDFEDSSSERDRTLLLTEFGWEYFFNNSVSGTIGIRYTRTETDSDSSDDYTSDSLTTNLGFKLYF